MMGDKKQPDPKMFFYGVNLDKRVRRKHPLRRIAKRIDFEFVRERVKEFYGTNGHVSEDPIVVVKLMFLLFFENVSSERELMRQVWERLDWMWFLGFDLETTVPHHSILSKARARWGQEIFEELFVRVVAQCVKAGLVKGSKIHVDGSLVDANASVGSVKAGSGALMETLKAVYLGQEAKLDFAQSKADKRQSVSRTDPEAAVVGRRNQPGNARPRYKNHRVVDDQSGIITAVETTPGDVSEGERLFDLVEQHQRNTDCQVETVVADSGYGTNQNFAECVERGIEAHMADLRASGKGKVEIFKQEDFQYDATADQYVCPAGQELRRSGKKDPEWQIYRIRGRICNQCSLKSQCTKSPHGRILKRHVQHDLIVLARVQSHSPQGRSSRRRRKHLMEGSFADAANNHHFKRARWRGLKRQQIQDLLIATCQNIRKLMRCFDWKTAGEATLGRREGRFCAPTCPSLAERSPLRSFRSFLLLLNPFKRSICGLIALGRLQTV